MKRIIFLLLTLAILGTKEQALAQISDAPSDARSYIIYPQHGATVPATFTVLFGLKGMGVAPAGAKLDNTGHHHLLIDLEELPDLKMPLPVSDNVLHFGLGQTETTITLSPGKHTLQLVLGDFAHIPHKNPVVSEKIIIYVSEK